MSRTPLSALTEPRVVVYLVLPPHLVRIAVGRSSPAVMLVSFVVHQYTIQVEIQAVKTFVRSIVARDGTIRDGCTVRQIDSHGQGALCVRYP